MQFRFAMGLALVLYILANGFIAYRGYKKFCALATNSPFPKRWHWAGRIWIILVVGLGISPLMSRSMGNLWPTFLPDGLLRIFSWIGYDWMVICLVWAFLFVLVDLIFYGMQKLLVFRSNQLAARNKNTALFFLLLIYLLGGTYFALSSHWTTYDITIAKNVPGYTQMKLICISDLHLGELIRSNRLEAWVREINARQPDMICLLGDIFDEGPQLLGEEEATCQAFLAELNAPLGVYACIGNHDRGWGEQRESIQSMQAWFEAAGIELLVDQFVWTEGMVIAGKDYTWGATNASEALAFLEEAPKDGPVILLDHEPGQLEDAAAAGVDLVLSGHTHKGQIFPGNLITNWLYETDYGYATNGESQIVVSSGAGTWGPVLRWGSRSELIEIQLHFTTS